MISAVVPKATGSNRSSKCFATTTNPRVVPEVVSKVTARICLWSTGDNMWNVFDNHTIHFQRSSVSSALIFDCECLLSPVSPEKHPFVRECPCPALLPSCYCAHIARPHFASNALQLGSYHFSFLPPTLFLFCGALLIWLLQELKLASVMEYTDLRPSYQRNLFPKYARCTALCGEELWKCRSVSWHFYDHLADLGHSPERHSNLVKLGSPLPKVLYGLSGPSSQETRSTNWRVFFCVP